MKKKLFLPVATAVLMAGALAAGCDDGRIYPPASAVGLLPGAAAGVAVVNIAGGITGVEAWIGQADYHVAVAAFGPQSRYALVSRNIAAEPCGDDDGGCRFILEGIPAEATSIELCVIDRLRKRVATIAEATIAPGADTLKIDMGSLWGGAVDVSPLAAVERAVFAPTCGACHGGPGAAAGVDLQSVEAARRSLVGVAATADSSLTRVSPGSREGSLLWAILAEGASASWRYDHSVEVTDPALLALIGLWIDLSAK